MKPSQTIRMGTLAALAATLLSAAPASAEALPASAVSCRAAIGKSYSKLVNTAVKTVSACHKARDKGDLSLTAVNCNNLLGDAANVDPKGKWASAVAKHEAAVTTGCPETVAPFLIQPDGEADFYTTCPVACPGVPTPLTTMAQVGKCLGCEAAAIADTAFEATLGLPAQLSQSSANQKCRGAIGKGYGKYLATYSKSAIGCQGDQDEAGDNALTDCLLPANNDPKGKVAGALTKAAEGLDKSCVGADLTVMDSCATDTLANVKSCAASEWGSAAEDTFTTNYELPATGCPSTIRTTIRGACSVNGDTAGNCSSGFATSTELSVGWKGMGHGVDITDSYTLAGSVTCPGTEKGTCGDCTVTGISTDNPQYQAFTRCVDDPSRECNDPFVNDLDCGTCAGGVNANDNCTSDGDCPGSTCTAGACRYYLGPPLSISAGGTPTCTLNVINTNITGTSNPDTGNGALSLDLRAIVHTGNSQSRPCPICRNDPTPRDGVKGGTCLGGPQEDNACDVQGFDLSFAPTDANNPTAGPSLDCPPSIGANISGSGLAITLPLTTGTSSKSAQDACEAPNGSLNCFCGVCSGDNTKSCETDTDCSGLGLGVCGRGNGVDRKPNNCTDGTCNDTLGRTDRGECAPADDDSYCSGVLFANGHGVIPCNTDSDCDSYISLSSNPDAWVCPGNECGTCTVESPRSCFLDPYEVTGTPDTENPVMVGTFCLPPSSNGSVNNATGSPGPGAVKTDAIIELRY